MKVLKLTVVFLLITVGVISAPAQTQSKTYSETRKLLVKMERPHANEMLKKLFEEGETRKSDLIQALYDSDQKISLNAQSVILYLSDPQALSALEEWYSYRRKKSEDYWISPVKLVTEVKYLDGNDGDLAKLVLKNLYPNSHDVWAKQVAFNKSSKAALIEVVFGEIFTEGWHVVIRKENGRWRLLSQYLVWQS
jgi:hypothetical protein